MNTHSLYFILFFCDILLACVFVVYFLSIFFLCCGCISFQCLRPPLNGVCTFNLSFFLQAQSDITTISADILLYGAHSFAISQYTGKRRSFGSSYKLFPFRGSCLDVYKRIFEGNNSFFISFLLESELILPLHCIRCYIFKDD